MFEIINDLYQNEVKLKEDTISYILTHSNEYTNILENIIKNAKNEYLTYEKDPCNSTISYYHVIHSSMLLAEMQSENSIETILNFLENDYDILEFWLGDVFTEEFWYVIWKLGKKSLSKLFEFLECKEHSIIAKAVIGMGITKIYQTNVELQDMIIENYRKLLTKDNISEDQKAFIITDIIEMGTEKLKKEINEVYNEIEHKQSVIYRSEIENPEKMRNELYKADDIYKIYKAMQERTLSDDSGRDFDDLDFENKICDFMELKN